MPKQNCDVCGKEYIEAVYHHRGSGFRYDKSFGSYMCNDCREASKSIGVVAIFDIAGNQQNCEEAGAIYQEEAQKQKARELLNDEFQTKDRLVQEEAQEKQEARELLNDEFQAKDQLVQELKIQLEEEKQKNQILQQKLEKTLINLKGIVQEVEGQRQQNF